MITRRLLRDVCYRAIIMPVSYLHSSVASQEIGGAAKKHKHLIDQFFDPPNFWAGYATVQRINWHYYSCAT